jgi:putative NADH-flavin reductase
MKITVFGATGMVGSRIVAEALRRRHDVTAVTHTGTTMDGTNAAEANFTDTRTVSALANAADVTVIAIPPDRESDEPVAVNLDAHRRLLDAAPSTRLIVVGGAGSLLVDGTPLRDTPGFPEEFKREAGWGIELLNIYREAPAGIDWLLVSPSPMIAPGQATGKYLVGTDSPVGDAVSAENFAIGILDEIDKHAHRRMRITLADAS